MACRSEQKILKPITVKLLTVIAILFYPATYAWADRPAIEDDKANINFVYENDIFANEDRGYTDGIRLAWLSSETGAPEWVKKLVKVFPVTKNSSQRISMAVGQSMFTPADLNQTNPPSDDQPYAGWLYGTVGVVSDTGTTLDTIALTLGVVGPYSYAEQTQKEMHHITGSPHPRGWDNQLHNEVAGDIAYQRKWRNMLQFSPFGFGLDVTPDVGATLGTVNTNASIGTTFRLGYDLPTDYGPPRIHPSLPASDFFIPTRKLSGYLFSGIEGRAVARNLFLDGNTFESSPHVEKEFFTANLQCGAAITYQAMRLSYTHVFMTKEFKTQEKAPQFGGISFSYRF